MSFQKRPLKIMFVFIFLVFAIISGYQLSLAQSGTVWHVKYDADGASDGTSWEDAFNDLQDALAEAQAGDEVWVAAGIYYPGPEPGEGQSPERGSTFNLVSGAAMYGGFAGGETSLEQRDWESNVTVLSGDLERNDNTDAEGVVTDPDNIVGENAYHVVTVDGTGAGTILDGFIITGGHADNLNDKVQHGAGLHSDNSELFLGNITFTGNRAEQVNDDTSRALGGGMYSFNSEVYMTDVIFSNNHANRGGGLYQGQDSGVGPIYGTGLMTVSDARFENNTAVQSGGGLYNDRAELTINRTLFRDNLSGQGGGGIYTYYTNLEATKVDFENNTANENGGAGLKISLLQDVTLTEVNFTGNKTGDSAGGSNWGGGLGVREGNGMLKLVNATFSANEAMNGGGIYLFVPHQDGEIIMANVLISGNKAMYGGGIDCRAQSLSMINVTLSGNSAGASGSAIRNMNYTPTLVNSIIWGNDENPINNRLDGNLEFRNSLIQGSGGSGGGWDEELGIDGGGNLDADPLFVNPAAASDAPTSSGDYRIQPGSPAVDAGSNSPFEETGDAFGVETDLDGNPRIIGGVVDIGAYELVYEEVDTGSLTVTIEPEEVRDLGARWTIDGGTNWYESGTELNLDPGDYDLSFNEIAGLSAPPGRVVSINRGLTTAVTGTYRPEVIHVKHNASGNGDGSSWESAYTCLQQALEDSREGIEIWVAAGMYLPQLPNEGDPLTATFQLTDGVAVYGGFGGTETSREERDWENNITVLSGDLDGDDNANADGIVTDPDDIVGDNAYTVVTAVDVGVGTILDGFVITAGKSDDLPGGGMYIDNSSPILENLILTGCYGGGIYNTESTPSLLDVVIKSNQGIGMRNEDSNPYLTRVLFESNTGNGQNSSGGGMLNNNSDPILYHVDFVNNGVFLNKSPGYGGGMVNANSNPILINVSFRGNYAYYEGGGMRNSNSSPTLVNVLFSGNATDFRGGGMYNRNSNSQPTLVNVTFSSNYAGQFGGAMFNRLDASPTLVNCIIWQNFAPVSADTVSTEIWNHEAVPTVSHSIIEGSGGSSSWEDYFGIDGGNNLDADPLFVNRPPFSNAGHTGGDFRLQAGSPAIDAGNNSHFESGGIAYGIAADLDGSPRIDSDLVDLGAYEYQAAAVTVSTPGELADAVQNPEVDSIKFGSSITADINATRLINLDFSAYTLDGSVQYNTSSEGSIVLNGSGDQNISGNLTIDAPNATVTNNARVGGTVNIISVAGDTWIENADGNDLVIDFSEGINTVTINGSVNSLTVNGSGEGLNIIIEGSVATAVFNAPATVTGAQSINDSYVAPEVIVEMDGEPQQNVYILSLGVDPAAGGTVEGEGLYPEFREVAISAQAQKGYRFVNWTTTSGVLADADAANTTFTMSGQDVTVTANFESDPTISAPSRGGRISAVAYYMLNLEVEGEGSVSPATGEHSYKDGAVVDLEAVPAEGWVFSGWEGAVKEAENPVTTVTVKEDVEVTAVFLEKDVTEKRVIKLDIGSNKALVDGSELLMDVAPFVRNGRTFVPLRFVAEAFGAEVLWERTETSATVTISREGLEIIVTIGSPVITVVENGIEREVDSDVAAFVENGRTWLPLRAVGEIMGLSFDWGPKDGTIQWVSIEE